MQTAYHSTSRQRLDSCENSANGPVDWFAEWPGLLFSCDGAPTWGHAPADPMLRRAIPWLFAMIFWAGAAPAQDSASTHVVSSGQRLGSIAKRYNVSIEALCEANGIRRRDPIRPGQRLVIPGRGKSPSARKGDARREAEPVAEAFHRVESGQRLESIARRYGVTVASITEHNRIDRRSVLKVGQVLRIPEPKGPAATGTAKAFSRTPKHRGRLELVGHTQRFKGEVFDKKGRVLPGARRGVSRVLGVGSSDPRLDDRLLRSLVTVSDHFGGRPLRIVSGYRRSSYFKDSKHKASRAVDFSIPGVPNEVVRDYVRGMQNVGVGYYPNSSFIHLDVREYSAYWVDYARPGEPPRKSPRGRAHAENELHDEEPNAPPAAPTPALDVAGATPSPPAIAPPAPIPALPAAGTARFALPGSGTVPAKVVRPAPARNLVPSDPRGL